jgi:hypothetical protein
MLEVGRAGDEIMRRCGADDGMRFVGELSGHLSGSLRQTHMCHISRLPYNG